MADQYKKTIVLGLNYSDFSGGITECNRKMGLLDAEFARATEEARLYGSESDQLRLKQDMLTQKIELQRQKVLEAEKAYNRAAEANENGGRAVDNANRAYIQQQTALLRLEGQLRETTDEMEELNESNQTFGDSIREVADVIGLQASPAIEAFASKFDGTKKEVGEAIVLIGALGAAYANLSVDLAHTADNILTLSITSGLSTDTLQELQYASEFVDVSVETMNGSMTKLIKNMDSARDGNEGLQKTFAQLGVKYKDGNKQLRDAEDVFYDLVDALGKVKNETDRDAMAMELFGKSARDLNPLIEAGSKRLKELGNEAHEVGYVLSNDTLQSAGAFDDAMQSMDRKIEAVKLQLGTYLLPVLTTFVEILSSIPTPVLIGIGVFGTLVMVLGSVAKAAIALSTANQIAAATNFLLGTSGAAATAGLTPLLLILLAIAAAIALIVGIKMTFDEPMNKAKTAAESIASASQNMQQPKYHANGTEYYEGGETWVGENGAEKVVLPRGSKIYSAEDSRNQSETNVFYVTIDAKNVDDFNRVVRLAKNEQVAYRTGKVRI